MAVPTSMRFYRYRVESLNIIIPSDKTYSIDGPLIKGITIERNYESDMFPIIRLNLSLSTELYYKIIENTKTVSFRLRIQKYIYDENNALTMKQDVINDAFVIFTDDNTPFFNKDIYESAANITSSESSKGMTPVTVGGNDLSFYLFKEKDLIASKAIVNGVLKQGTITDAIAFMLSRNGFNKILMTPLDNNTVYDEIIIPPFSLQGNLIYLENQFGYYYNGSIIFFDIPYLYILNRSVKTTAWITGEYPRIIFSVKTSDNANKFTPGSYFDNNQLTTFINVQPTSITTNSVSIIRDQLEGNHRLIINPTTGEPTNMKMDTLQRGDGTYKVVVNKYNNPFLNTAHKADIESDNQHIQIALDDIDFEAIAPNKEYSFKYEDGNINKIYGGNYRMTKSIVFFANSGDHFKLKATMSFRR